MKAKDQSSVKRERHSSSKSSRHIRWLITLFVLSMAISATFSFLSQKLLGSLPLVGAFLVLLVIIAIGIVFDLLGIAVTAADEKPFHSMAARKVRGAAEAIRLLRNADRVSSVCNDVVGDICGIISGAAAAVIAIEAMTHFQTANKTLLQLLLSALVAALTICGKAFCKPIALENSTVIVHGAAKVIFWFRHPFSRKNKRKL